MVAESIAKAGPGSAEEEHWAVGIRQCDLTAHCSPPLPAAPRCSYSPDKSASLFGVFAMRLISHSMPDCGGICPRPRRSVYT